MQQQLAWTRDRKCKRGMLRVEVRAGLILIGPRQPGIIYVAAATTHRDCGGSGGASGEEKMGRVWVLVSGVFWLDFFFD